MSIDDEGRRQLKTSRTAVEVGHDEIDGVSRPKFMRSVGRVNATIMGHTAPMSEILKPWSLDSQEWSRARAKHAGLMKRRRRRLSGDDGDDDEEEEDVAIQGRLWEGKQPLLPPLSP